MTEERNLNQKSLPILGLIFTLLLSACAGPPEVPDERVVSRADFLHPEWSNENIETLCLFVRYQYPEPSFGADITPFLLEFLKAPYMSYEVVPQDQACDAELNVDLRAEGLASTYQGTGGCTTGYRLDGQITLSSEGREQIREEWSVRQQPSDSVSASFECTTGYIDAMDRDLVDGLADMLGNIWDSNVYYPFYRALPDLTAAEWLMQPPQADYIPLYIVLITRFDNYSLPVALLGQLGPQAERAIPYLLHALGESEAEVYREEICNALQSISGEDISCVPRQWWDWWDEQETT